MSATHQTGMAPAGAGGNGLAFIGRVISQWWRSYIVWHNHELAIATLQQFDNRLLKDI